MISNENLPRRGTAGIFIVIPQGTVSRIGKRVSVVHKADLSGRESLHQTYIFNGGPPLQPGHPTFQEYPSARGIFFPSHNRILFKKRRSGKIASPASSSPAPHDRERDCKDGRQPFPSPYRLCCRRGSHREDRARPLRDRIRQDGPIAGRVQEQVTVPYPYHLVIRYSGIAVIPGFMIGFSRGD